MKQLVCVVIPVYTNDLTPEERRALANNLQKLGRYPCVFIYPDGFDIQPLHQAYPRVGLLKVSDNWLGTRRGIAGYNEMMMSAEFYSLFSDYEYIFICHYDAWIFRDEVETWCRKGYDLVAAPWPTRKRYTHFPLKQYIRLKLLLKPRHKILHCQMFGRIGNGGLCLRKVETFRKACIDYKEDIDYYNAHADVLHNEDLFWALVPKLNVPSVDEAMKFSFDLKPQLLYEQNGRQLPMACHGFNKPNRRKFWSRFLTQALPKGEEC